MELALVFDYLNHHWKVVAACLLCVGAAVWWLRGFAANASADLPDAAEPVLEVIV